MTEIWRPVKGFEGRLEVSNLGRIKRIARTILRKDGIPMTFKEKFLEVHSSIISNVGNRQGYPVVCLSTNGKPRVHYVHRIVAEAFLPPKEFENQVIQHIDGDNLNNRVDNLRYGFHADAVRRAHARGAYSREEHYSLSENKVVKLLKQGIPLSRISHEIGLPNEVIREYQKQLRGKV
jgi:hypothetical protein